MNGYSSQSDVSGGSKGLLVCGHLLQIIQCLPTIYHPVWGKVNLTKSAILSAPMLVAQW